MTTHAETKAEASPNENFARPPEFSDEALATRFADQHQDELRYVAGWGCWYIWRNTRWQRDNTLHVRRLAREVCRSASAECRNERLAKEIASAKTIGAVERLAMADPRLAATVEQWDRDPWLLNTPGGAVDLRLGETRPHRREDYCTRVTAVAPGGDCPTWHAFLGKVTDGDTELQIYLKHVAGYCLTGRTTEQCLFFLHGTGRNGKSSFVNTIAGVMGDYATVAPSDAFVATHKEQHPTQLAGLFGARLVITTETEDGKRWAEARIKALTGGDMITARFMRQDFFSFTPEFKLMIAGNHRPSLRNVDIAMRRRLHLIPFQVTIAEDEQDPDLFEKLKAEWPGILAWMIEGAAEWAMVGLKQSEAVRNATDDYLTAEDVIDAWCKECCVLGLAYTATSADLFTSWRTYCEAAGEYANTQKWFIQTLRSRLPLLERWLHPVTRRAGIRGIQVVQEMGAHWSDKES